MSALAIAGLSTIVASWSLLFGSILVLNVRSRRRARQSGTVAQGISWIELVPVLVIAIAATVALNRWQVERGYVVVGAIHGALIIVLLVAWLRQRPPR